MRSQDSRYDGRADLRLMLVTVLAAAVVVSLSIGGGEVAFAGHAPATAAKVRPKATSPGTTSATGTATPRLTCAAETAVWFDGRSYCPGYVVGVTTNAYGAGSRIALEGAVVLSVEGGVAVTTDGTHCLPDPSGQPTFCGATLDLLTVDFTGSVAVPTAGDVIDLFGVTDGAGGLRPDGYIVTGWSDPLWWT